MSDEPNAVPDQRSITDQLIDIVRDAERAGRYDGAALIQALVTARVDKKIAEVSEPADCLFCGNARVVNGIMPDTIAPCPKCRADQQLFKRAAPLAPDASHSDAVKEAIAAIEVLHRDCGDRCGLINRATGAEWSSEEITQCIIDCAETKRTRPLLTALADAERKLVDANIEADKDAVAMRRASDRLTELTMPQPPMPLRELLIARADEAWRGHKHNSELLAAAGRQLRVVRGHYVALEAQNFDLTHRLADAEREAAHFKDQLAAATKRERVLEERAINAERKLAFQAIDLLDAQRKGDQEWQRTHYYRRLRHYANEASEMRGKLADAEKRAKDAEAEAERQSIIDATMIANFDTNSAAENWIGWRTRPDAEGRVFDCSVQLVGGVTLLDCLKELEAGNAALTRKLATTMAALKQISEWKGFPYTTDRNGCASTYGLEYGSNGERDFMRKGALDAMSYVAAIDAPAEEQLPKGCSGIDQCALHQVDHGHPEPANAQGSETCNHSERNPNFDGSYCNVCKRNVPLKKCAGDDCTNRVVDIDDDFCGLRSCGVFAPSAPPFTAEAAPSKLDDAEFESWLEAQDNYTGFDLARAAWCAALRCERLRAKDHDDALERAAEEVNPVVVECALGGNYEMPDGRSFWIDGPVAREMTQRVMTAIAAQRARKAE